MKTVNLQQNSPEWHAHRAKHFNASDAPAMMGVSKYTTRDELLAQLKTGIAKEVDKETEKRFEDGHKYEALARPLAEQIIGEELYPVVGVEGKYSASFDGLTMGEDINFEHKSLNDELRQAEDDADYLPLLYRVQMDHQALVGKNIKKTVFMASKWKKVNHVTEHFVLVNSEGFMDIEGTPEYYELEEEKHWWYIPDKNLQEKIIAGWEQLEKDLETFVPPQKTVKVEAEVVKSLPVPSIVAQGALVASNLNEVTPYFDEYLSKVKTELATDQDFADGEANAKHCRESAKSLKNVAKAVIGQIVEINDAVSLLEQYAAKFDAMGLRLEKAVKEQKDQIKANAIMLAKSEYEKHVTSLENSVIPLRSHLEYPNFAEAIKNVKTIETMQSRLNDAVAKGKAEASTLASNVMAKLDLIFDESKGYEHLFRPNELAFKDIEFIKLHIQTTKEAEDKRRNEVAEAAKQKAIQEAEARAKVEAEAKPVERVVEPTKTILPPAVEKEFGKQFVDGLDDELNPTRIQLIAAVAFFYKVKDTQAEAWLIDRFGAMEKAA